MENAQERRPLTPEEIKIRKQIIAKKRRFRKALVKTVGTVLISAVLILIILLVFFRVKSFNISDELNYPKDVIVEASGIVQGKSILFVDTEKVAELISTKLPYIDKVKVTKKLPSKIVIKAEDAIPMYAVLVGSHTYAVTNENMKILEITGELPEDIILVEGVSVKNAEAGYTMKFAGNGKDYVLDSLTTISNALLENGLGDINEVNIKNKDYIYLVYQSRIVIKLGDGSDLDKKLSLVKKAVAQENANSDRQTGELNVMDPEKAVFAAKDAKTIPELVDYLENKESIDNTEEPIEEESEVVSENTTESQNI